MSETTLRRQQGETNHRIHQRMGEVTGMTGAHLHGKSTLARHQEMRNGAGIVGTGNHLGHPKAGVQKQGGSKGGPTTDGNTQVTHGINEQSRRNRHFLQGGYYVACVSWQLSPPLCLLHSLLSATCLRSGFRYRFCFLLSFPIHLPLGHYTWAGFPFYHSALPPAPPSPALSPPPRPSLPPSPPLCVALSQFSIFSQHWLLGGVSFGHTAVSCCRFSVCMSGTFSRRSPRLGAFA